MKDTGGTLKTFFASEVTTVATCWKIIRTDGNIFAFTDWPEDVIYDSITYTAATGFSRTALDTSEGLNVNNMDVTGIIDSSEITKEDLVGGRYINADVWIFELNPYNIGSGIQKLQYGKIGRISHEDDLFNAEIRDITSLLGLEVGDKYTRYCPYRLGDSNCTIELSPTIWQASENVSLLEVRAPSVFDGYRYVCTTAGTTDVSEPSWLAITTDNTVEWTRYPAYRYNGTVTGVSSKQIFQDSSLTNITNDFRFGEIEFTSGLNNGLVFQVKSSSNTGVFELIFPAPFAINISDTFIATVGCNHLLRMSFDEWGTAYSGDCVIKFNLENGGNARHFGGDCEIPGNEDAINIV